MKKKKCNVRIFFIYEIILFILYLSVTIGIYFNFDHKKYLTINLIAIGSVINLIVFVLSLLPQTRKIPKEERIELDLNSAGVQMAQTIYTFFITGLNTVITIFFIALVLASAIGRI